eukprot:5121816-Alexandrium_andersonii.AAC.1
MGPCLALLAVATGSRNLVLINSYAPHAGRPLDERRNFHGHLAKMTDRVGGRSVIIKMGGLQCQDPGQDKENI